MRERALWGRIGGIFALALVYVAAARLGLMLGAFAGFATLVWAPSGIALAALSLFGYGLWPGIAAGAFAVNLWTGAPAAVALAIAAGNTLEAVAGVYALRRLAHARAELDRLRSIVVLIVAAAIGSTVVSATAGVASLWLAGIVAPGHFVETWRAWWIGDAMGDLVVAPLFMVWSRRRYARVRSWRALEAGAATVLLAAVALAVFLRSPSPSAEPLRQPYIVFPVLLWIALRFDVRGATLAAFGLSGVAIACTAAGRGPFAHGALGPSLLYLQAFMAVATATGLLLGAAVAERVEDMRLREWMLAVVSHDLKSPLSAVRLSAQTLARRSPGDELVARQVGIIQRAVVRMTSLISGLLDLAALDAGRLALAIEEHDARALVSEAVEPARPLAEERSLALEAEPAGPPLRVLCDRERVLQVLTNLIDNAMKFTPAGGSIAVRVETQGETVQFSVADSGPGIEARQLGRVFQPFWRAHGGGHPGTGLGLSIVKGIVEAHGGRAWAESTPGAGSTFRFTLPAAPSGDGRAS